VLSIEDLQNLGASDVVVEEFEATLELFARVLECYEVPTNTIYRELETVRAEQYGFLREETQAENLKLDKLRHLGIYSTLEILETEEGAEAVGESPASLALRERTGAIVVAVVRAGKPVYPSGSGFLFRKGDTVVLVGDAASLARASEYFRSAQPQTPVLTA
jgi:CPA2 family monovalent cation:H+ antiporter-2